MIHFISIIQRRKLRLHKAKYLPKPTQLVRNKTDPNPGLTPESVFFQLLQWSYSFLGWYKPASYDSFIHFKTVL